MINYVLFLLVTHTRTYTIYEREREIAKKKEREREGGREGERSNLLCGKNQGNANFYYL